MLQGKPLTSVYVLVLVVVVVVLIVVMVVVVVVVSVSVSLSDHSITSGCPNITTLSSLTRSWTISHTMHKEGTLHM